jgi:DNA-binding IscR family transcriptional regulator
VEQATLCAQSYMSQHRSEKGVVKQYIAKVTGPSRAQLTRLIAQYVANGIVKVRRGTGKRYTASYTPADIVLLAEVDEALFWQHLPCSLP